MKQQRKESTSDYLSDAHKRRQMPNTPLRKPAKPVDDLPLFNPHREHESKQEKAQQNLFT
jgi:hypothetical protein